MAKTPANVPLSSHVVTPTPGPTIEPRSTDAEFPRVVYHKSSKADALVAKQVENADELKALGSEWGPLSALKIETAPAAKE